MKNIEKKDLKIKNNKIYNLYNFDKIQTAGIKVENAVVDSKTKNYVRQRCN